MASRTTLLTAALAALFAEPALAAPVTEEVIVYATKRAQTLQEVPVAVTVTSAETIEKAKIRDIKDLQAIVPSLRIPTFLLPVATNFVIRGFGNGGTNVGIEPSVGFGQALIHDSPRLHL